MRNWISCLLVIFSVAANAQEKLNTFQIADSTTKKAVPSVSVSIVRAKLAISTEKDGIFSIPGNLAAMRDTIIFTVQNYQVTSLPLQKLHGMDTIFLKKIQPGAVLSNAVARRDTLLNDFNRHEITYYAGIHTSTALFEFLQLAQQFDNSKPGALLKNVTICRLQFHVNFELQENYAQIEPCRFRLRIYDVDQSTGKPGNDLCDKIIEVKSVDDSQIKVNLEDYQIAIPNKTFFVAVEWIRDFYNMGYSQYYDQEKNSSKKLISYRPALGISPIKNPKLNIWGLDFKQRWKPYNYFYPDGTDLAIKATIKL